MKRLIPLFFLFALVLPSYGSHIVGGEFELLHLSGFTYRLNLILYFDELNAIPGIRDANALARIFRKSDNAALLDVNIPYISQSSVAYFQPACAHGEVVTLRLLYSTTINLPAEDFNHPDGYYVTWQRCCRNYNIDNIFSEDPNLGGTHAGQTFFLEFPPVVNASGDPFINSSPNLFPVLSDLVCANREYWLDFSGKDVDGDSLTYTLVTPLNTFNRFGTPRGGPRPGPYPEVLWRTDLGFGIDNIVNGSPDLQISPKGFLTVRPTEEGLFLFSVKCEEYRDKIKIGELIRDFQMFVVDACPSATAPVITTKTATETTYSDVSSIDIVVPNTAEGANRCIYVQVSDSDAAIATDGFEEKISLRAIGLNFNPEIGELESILPDIKAATLKDGSSQQFEICFPKCPFSNTPSSGIFQIGIIVNDDSCPLPLFDQLTLRVRIIPPDNNAPVLLVSDIADATTYNDVSSMDIVVPNTAEGANRCIQIQVSDLDAARATYGFEEKITLKVVSLSSDPKIGELESILPDIRTATLKNGSSDQFEICFPRCPFSNIPSSGIFPIEITANDDSCPLPLFDQLTLRVRIIPPDNNAPVLLVSGNEVSKITQNEISGIKTISIPIQGLDADGHDLMMQINPVGGFDLKRAGMEFTNVPDARFQLGPINTTFNWKIDCTNNSLDFSEGRIVSPEGEEVVKQYKIEMLLKDQGECGSSEEDKLDMEFNIRFPSQFEPNVYEVENGENVELLKYQFYLTENINLDIRAKDRGPNPDNIDFIARGSNFNLADYGAKFEDKIDHSGEVTTPFQWSLDCDKFNLAKRDSFRVHFIVEDNDICNLVNRDVLTIDFLIDLVPNTAPHLALTSSKSADCRQ